MLIEGEETLGNVCIIMMILFVEFFSDPSSSI